MVTKKKSKAAKEPQFKEKDDGTYQSRSSIDNPPRPPKDEKADEPKQQSLIDEPDAVERFSQVHDGEQVERSFGVDLCLKLTRQTDGKTIPVPLLSGEWPANRIQELITISVKSRLNKQIIEAILDLPKKESKKADEKPAAKCEPKKLNIKKLDEPKKGDAKETKAKDADKKSDTPTKLQPAWAKGTDKPAADDARF